MDTNKLIKLMEKEDELYDRLNMLIENGTSEQVDEVKAEMVSLSKRIDKILLGKYDFLIFINKL